MNKIKILFLTLSFILIIVFLGRNLNPFSSRMFQFHDETQPARVQQFTSNLKRLEIPPRVAYDFDQKKGYPVFNFYSPFAYWVTSFINLTGLSIIVSLKLSFLLALLTAFLGTFLFFRLVFDFYPALLGGIFYVTSLYFPVDIFVRGNLAEIWFLALLPLGFYFILLNSQKPNKLTFFFGTLILSFIFTSHNIYSLISIPIIIIFSFLLKNKRQNLLMLGSSLLLTAYFWLPALTEMKYTIAKEMAAKTNFHDHFLCWWQLWQSPWGFGGSTAGCIEDGISFMIGKIQIIFFVLGSAFFAFNYFKCHSRPHSGTGSSGNPEQKALDPRFHGNDKHVQIRLILLYFVVSTILLLFLTTYQSQFIWNFFSPLMSVIQFPWRFIGISLLGIVFLSSYFFQKLKIPLKNFFTIFIIISVLIINGKHFYGKEINNNTFEKKYLSQEYIQNKAALAIPEYFPNENVKIRYGKTEIEKVGNLISVITMILLLIYILKKSKHK